MDILCRESGISPKLESSSNLSHLLWLAAAIRLPPLLLAASSSRHGSMADSSVIPSKY